jgi:AcrR family transcriptional regulator
MGSRLQPNDWSRAALEAIAEGGLGAVIIETLATRIGATKGSFYWHFADRAALIRGAAVLWEETRTSALIRDLQQVEEPRQRLHELFIRAFGDDRAGRIEAALIMQPEDPEVAEVVRRVTTRRVAFLANAFAEIGFTESEAQHRAVVAYGTYLGLFVVLAGNPNAAPSRGRPLDTFVGDLIDLLTRR